MFDPNILLCLPLSLPFLPFDPNGLLLSSSVEHLQGQRRMKERGKRAIPGYFFSEHIFIQFNSSFVLIYDTETFPSSLGRNKRLAVSSTILIIEDIRKMLVLSPHGIDHCCEMNPWMNLADHLQEAFLDFSTGGQAAGQRCQTSCVSCILFLMTIHSFTILITKFTDY